MIQRKSRFSNKKSTKQLTTNSKNEPNTESKQVTSREESETAFQAISQSNSLEDLSIADEGVTMNRLQDANADANKTVHDTALKITAPIRNVVHLEPAYRTRYGAWSVIILVWLLSIAAIIWRGEALEWLLATSMTMVIICSGLLPIFASRQLSYQRKCTNKIMEHEDLLITIELNRKLPIPGTWYVIHDCLQNQSHMRDSVIKLRASFSPFFHKHMQLSYRLKKLERGNYQANQATIAIGDWLGLTCIQIKVTARNHLLVLPAVRTPEDETYVAKTTSSVWMKKQRKLQQQLNEKSQQDAEFADWDNTGNTHHESKDMNVGGSSLEDPFKTRPYREGDDYRRLDIRAAARGLGLHTKNGEDEPYPPKLCLLLDQFDLPYQDELRDQLFGSLLSWYLADIVEASQKQAVSILCDNWCLEYGNPSQLLELQHLLATLKSDVALNIGKRVPFYYQLLPSHGHIVVYSGAWKDAEGWLKLAEAAWMKGSRLELQFITTNRVMTYAMREQQKVLESAGIIVVWRYGTWPGEAEVEIEQGSEHYATG